MLCSEEYRRPGFGRGVPRSESRGAGFGGAGEATWAGPRLECLQQFFHVLVVNFGRAGVGEGEAATFRGDQTAPGLGCPLQESKLNVEGSLVRMGQEEAQREVKQWATFQITTSESQQGQKKHQRPRNSTARSHTGDV